MGIIVSSVCGSPVDRKNHELYDNIKKYIDIHPNNYLEINTKSKLYISQIIFDYVKGIVDSYKEEILSDSKGYNMLDYLNSFDRFKQISEIIGEEKVERLETVVDEAFLICTV